MPKDYYCNKLLPNGTVCGEREISKFIDGRYTTCKNCRLRSMSDYNKSKTSKKKDTEATKTDPDCNIRYLIEDTIKRVPFIQRQTILERIESSEEDVTSVMNLHHEYVDKNDYKIDLLCKQLEEMKKEIKNLKEEIKNLNSEK
jgi:hypothetical protein